MDFEVAFEKYANGDRSGKVMETILQDAYGFLESENYHIHLEVIEKLTEIKYK